MAEKVHLIWSHVEIDLEVDCYIFLNPVAEKVKLIWSHVEIVLEVDCYIFLNHIDHFNPRKRKKS